MCCGEPLPHEVPSFGHKHPHEHGGDSSCSSFRRRFYTPEEKIAELEEYRDRLEKELAGVKEKIAELKKK
ncbi:MAG: hypothetical protein QME64_09665 [bacterium]|nr:hypothetical protein [bacterium]